MSDDKVGDAVAALYLEFFKLRQRGELQEEYDAMGTLLNMLTRDRQHMRVTFTGKIEI